MNHRDDIKNYFNRFTSFEKYRRKRSYYYNSLTRYCSFFINENQSILEIGCATGDLLNSVKGKYKLGIDISEKLIEIAKIKYPTIDFIAASVEEVQLKTTFDVILLSNVVGYLEDIQTVLEKIKTFSHRNTKIIITYYNKLWEGPIRVAEQIGLKRKSPHQNWLSCHDIRNLCYLAGMDVFKQTRNVIFPFYIPLLSAFLNRFISKLPLFNCLSLNQFTFARLMPIPPDPLELNQMFNVSVVIPARNEKGNIEHAILKMPRLGKSTEIVFIEGNSTDHTWETIQEMQMKYKDTHQIKIMRQEGKGKGDAVRKAFNECMGDILMILDADLTVPPEELPKFYTAIASGKADFINGCRLIYPMESQAMRTLNMMGNYFFSKAFSWILEQPIKDTLCGTKVLFKKDYEQLIKNRSFFGNFDPFGDFDLLFGAYKLNLKIIDMPIRYKERKYGKTNISRFSHGFLLLRMVVFAAFKIKFW